jgi:hypothetical protein
MVLMSSPWCPGWVSYRAQSEFNDRLDERTNSAWVNPSLGFQLDWWRRVNSWGRGLQGGSGRGPCRVAERSSLVGLERRCGGG